VWVTWITKLLSADSHCLWAAWFRAHNQYEKIPSDFDQARYSSEHGAMVQECADALTAEGRGVYIEDQNAFRLEGKNGATLGGKPGIVAISREGGLKVIDCKTGKPRSSDQFQVLVYMLVLPHTHFACKERTPEGELRYRSGQVLSIPAAKIDDKVRKQFRDMMERVSGDPPARKVPSPGECRYCDIPKSECPERVEAAAPPTRAGHDLF
jgi:hypothetical protein